MEYNFLRKKKSERPLYRYRHARKMLRSLSRFGRIGERLARRSYHQLIRFAEYRQKRMGIYQDGDPYIAVTTRVGCRNMCSFCPQKTFISAYKKRLEDKYGKTIPDKDDMVFTLENFNRFLRKIPSNFIVHFGGFSEPWTNPQCTEMCLSAWERGHPIRVFTSLTGMTPRDIQRIAHIPFITFSVHVPDAENTTRIHVDKVMTDVLQSIIKNGISNVTFHNHVGNPHPEFVKHIGHLIAREGLYDRAGSLGDFEGAQRVMSPHKGEIRCTFNLKSKELNHNILLPNGDVVLCCQDWGLRNVLGNISETDLASLYSSPIYTRCKNSLDDDSIGSLCRICIMAQPLR